MTSDEIVEGLRPYGRVHVHQADDQTFSANLRLHIVEMDATVQSGFHHPTMLSALTALQAKLGNVLPALSGGKALLT